jgi:hypothetical protein
VFAELHLFEFHQARLEYLKYYEARKQHASLFPVSLKNFGANEYGDKPITDDLITDIFIEFSDQTRQSESEEYLRTLKG